MYDPKAGRFLTEDPLGLLGGDANFYRYVGNSPIDTIDPSGLAGRKVNGYQVQDLGGNHYVPVELWAETGFDGPTFKIWDDRNARVFQPAGTGHDRSAHGKEGYTGHARAALQDEMAKYRCENGIKGKFNPQQQVDFATKFLDKIKGMPKSTFIGGFNDAVRRGGTREVQAWFRSVGKKLGPPGSALGAIGNFQMGCDAWNSAFTPGRNYEYETYYFEDENGTYHYEQMGMLDQYRGTDAVYDSGAKAGERVPTFWFSAGLRMWFKSWFNPPEPPSRHELNLRLNREIY